MKKMLKRKDFIEHLCEFEGIDLDIVGSPDDEFKQYDGGCNMGKLNLRARAVKLLERLQLHQEIDPKTVYIEMPGGATRGDVMIACESDVRMGALRKLRTDLKDQTRDLRKGREILITQAVRDEFKDIRNGFISMYLFPDAFVIVMKDRHDGSDVFDLQRNMIPVVIGLSSVKEELVLLREVSAKLTEDVFILGGKAYNRAKVFFRED
ncbi:hypothetical protein KWAN_73 [Erwinia phage vB_EamM_Kwan]|uniref:Uncharacterized protein n=1 Tax=Erwinia phage vB_EamM_Kwan TaxID=1883374 RepID=A0A1B2IDZ5_9CAUD|nr:hypothetical protein BIZ80_gp226 [Erwinia phage vB_EamM_Kwan]ANZ49425.1 hypothetical protein KWAN_73 [Erwinia phage vB_EamM_Kwan]